MVINECAASTASRWRAAHSTVSNLRPSPLAWARSYRLGIGDGMDFGIDLAGFGQRRHQPLLKFGVDLPQYAGCFSVFLLDRVKLGGPGGIFFVVALPDVAGLQPW